jgi:hypothetical protein
MNGFKMMVGLALTLVASFATAAEQASFSEAVSGNFVDTAIDTNGDGVAAASFMGVATGFRGGASYQGLTEIEFAATGLCDPGEVEGVIAAYSIVRRFSNGNLMFSRLVEGSFCLNPATGKAEVSISAEIIGGTGRFEGATGSYQINYEATALLPDPTGGIAHGAFAGTVTGTISEAAQ